GCTCLRFFGIGWRRRRGPRACPTRRSSDLQPADDFRARGGPPSCGGCPDGRRRSLNRRRHLLTILFFSRGRGIVSRGRGVGGVLGGRGRARVGSRSLLLKVGNRGQLLGVGLLLLDPRPVLLRSDYAEGEEHTRVVVTAQLCTPALVVSLNSGFDLDLELVRVSRDD